MFVKKWKAGHVIEAIGLPENYKHGVIRISFGENNEDGFLNLKKYFQVFEILERGKANEME